jgi:hypothetical protein
MKKIAWIVALLAALALIVTACPGGGDPDPEPKGPDDMTNPGGDVDAQNWFLATDDDGTKAPNNQLLLNKIDDPDGRTYVRIFFDPLGTDFDKIVVNFTISDGGANVNWQSVKDDSGTWGFDPTGLSDGSFIDWLEAGPLKFDPAERFTSSWGATGTKLDKSTMYFICFFATPNDPEDTQATFTLTGVSFSGSESKEPGEPGDPGENPNPPGVAPGDAAWYLATAEGGALKAVDNKWIFTESGKFAYIYFKPNANLNTITISFTVNPSVSVTRQCVYDTHGTWGWGDGEVTSGSNFDLSGGSSWWGHDPGVSLDKGTMKGICLAIGGATTFTLTNVTIGTN